MLLITPSLLSYPQTPRVTFQAVNFQSEPSDFQEGTRALTYDEILCFLEEVESGELETKCSPTQLEKVNQFIALLAKEGILPDESEEEMILEEDIEDLLNGQENPFEYAFNTGNYKDYMIAPSIY